MKKFRKNILKFNIPLTLFTIIIFAGCKPSLIGTNSYKFYFPDLHAVSSANLNNLYNAAITTLNQMDADITKDYKDLFSAKIIAKTAGKKSKKVTINIKPIATGSKVTIRIGLIGNKNIAAEIYNNILQNLTY